MVLGVIGRTYTYDPVHGTVTIYRRHTTTTVPLQTGLTFASTSGYAYVIGIQQRPVHRQWTAPCIRILLPPRARRPPTLS